MQADDQQSFHQRLAWSLSLAGLVPFVLLTLALLFIARENAFYEPAFGIFRTYSAIILSFLGGIRWGYALSPQEIENSNKLFDKYNLLISVLPSMVAWFTLMLPPQRDSLAVLILLVAFCAHGAWDSFSGNAEKLPAWFSRLRIVLTFAVAACHLAVFFTIG